MTQLFKAAILGSAVQLVCVVNVSAQSNNGPIPPQAPVSVIANTLGTNSCIQVSGSESHSNSAGNKTFVSAYSNYLFGTVTNTTSVEASFYGGVCNRGITNKQAPFNSYGGFGALTSVVAMSYGSIDSTVDQNLRFTFQMSAATDYMVLENLTATLFPGAQ